MQNQWYYKQQSVPYYRIDIMKAGISYYEPNQTTSLLDIIINVCYCMIEILFFFL